VTSFSNVAEHPDFFSILFTPAIRSEGVLVQVPFELLDGFVTFLLVQIEVG